MKLKKGDNILIIAGKDKGKQAKIIKVLSDKNKIAAEGINIRKKHQRPRKSGQKGTIVETPAFFDASNAMAVCPKCSLPARVGYKVVNGGKSRICKKCKAEI